MIVVMCRVYALVNVPETSHEDRLLSPQRVWACLKSGYEALILFR